MSEVIRQLKQKIDNSTYSSPIYLGAHPQYVGALRKSHNANLEEQLILGTDCVTTETWELEDESMVHNIIKEFHDGTETADYYKLTAKIYDEISDFEVDDNVLVFSSRSHVVNEQKLVLSSGSGVSDQILVLTSNPSSAANFGLKREVLSYIDTNGNEIKISTKITTQERTDETIITKEIIEREENVNGNY